MHHNRGQRPHSIQLSHGRTEGFTLVELMVVVGIVGVLAAVATSNYKHFVSKARQVEAKIALSAIYTAEQAFFAENSTYTACLKQIGYFPGSKKRYYLVGFGPAPAVDTQCGVNGTTPCNTWNFQSGAQCNANEPNHSGWPAADDSTASDVLYSSTVIDPISGYYKQPLYWHVQVGMANVPYVIPTVVTTGTFLAAAAGAINSSPPKTALLGEPNNINSGPCCDGWQIDQNKRLINSFSGI